MHDFTELSFFEAFPLWLEAHKPYISLRTIRDYKQYGDALLAFFGTMQIKNIGIGEIRGFQMWRSKEHLDTGPPESKYRHSACSVRIRNEINCVLKPILREAGGWVNIVEKKFRHLPVPREGSGHALPIEQWDALFAVGLTEKRWLLATHCLRLMFKGGFQFGEVRRVRRRDADLKRGTISIIVGAKNATVRPRTVALVPSALESLTWIIKRYDKLPGPKLPDDFILPHRSCIKIGKCDKPMGSIYRSVRAIVAEWVVRQPKTAQPATRPRDARVSTASLLLANSKLSLSTIERALGWTPSTAMRKRYFRADINQLRDAMNTLEGHDEEN